MVPRFLSPSEKKTMRNFIKLVIGDFEKAFTEEKEFLKDIEVFYLFD